jgi:hypothetical protein
MPDVSLSPPTCEPILCPDHPASPAEAVDRAPGADECDILNDDVMIEVAPDRPCATIRVKPVYAGRSTPIPQVTAPALPTNRRSMTL